MFVGQMNCGPKPDPVGLNAEPVAWYIRPETTHSIARASATLPMDGIKKGLILMVFLQHVRSLA